MEEEILGYSVNSQCTPQCLNNLFFSICQSQGKTWLACLNPHSYAVALKDAEFDRALHAADWLIPDGVGIVYASRWLGGNIRERVTGSDIFFGLHKRMNEVGGLCVFFLGATEETLAAIRSRMAQDYPNVHVAGTYSPPFRSTWSADEVDAMLKAINAAQPDVLWVGMTAPKQEKWIHDNLHHLDIRFAAAIGAVFDFYTGKVKRSPPLFQRLGLEWLPRLIQQPCRLWRRMFISAPVFLWDVFKARWAQKNH